MHVGMAVFARRGAESRASATAEQQRVCEVRVDRWLASIKRWVEGPVRFEGAVIRKPTSMLGEL